MGGGPCKDRARTGPRRWMRRAPRRRRLGTHIASARDDFHILHWRILMNTMHILVGLDFSESSLMALAHALKLAQRTGARLHLCHVVPNAGVAAPMNLGLNIPAEFPEAREARARMERLHADLG